MKTAVRLMTALVLLCSVLAGSLHLVPPAAASEATPIAEDPLETGTDTGSGDSGLSNQEVAVQILVQFFECSTSDQDPDESFSYAYSSNVTGGEDGDSPGTRTGTGCTRPSGWIVTLENSGDGTLNRTSLIVSGEAIFTNTVEEGLYGVIISDGVTSHALPGAITVNPGDSAVLDIFHYVSGLAPEAPEEAGTATISGVYQQCQDFDRDGEVDFLILGAAQAGFCTELVGVGAAGLFVQGEETNGSPFGPVPVEVADDGTFSIDVPYGMYTLTDAFSEQSSELFPVGDDNVSIRIYAYYGISGVPGLAYLPVEKVVCRVQAGDDRAGTTEFVIDRDRGTAGGGSQELAGTRTCYVDTSVGDEMVSLTLETSPPSAFTKSMTIAAYAGKDGFSGVPAGEYTLTETYGDHIATSLPFAVTYDALTTITIINYVEGDIDEDFHGDEFTNFGGTLYYCSSPDLAGQVSFVIDNAGFEAAGNSDCLHATDEQGQVTLSYYGSGDVPSATPVDHYLPERYADDYSFGPELTPGWYQLAFRDSSFSGEEFVSEIFPLSADHEDSGSQVTYYNWSSIYVYAAPAPALAIRLDKFICYDPVERPTDFVVTRVDVSDPALTGSSLTICRYQEFEDGTDTYTFTLTNTETGEEQVARGDISVPFQYTFFAVPAGTYTITESSGGIAIATSDEFEVEPVNDDEAGDNELYVEVRNYTTVAFERGGDNDAEFGLYAYVCENDSAEAHFEYTFLPFGEGQYISEPEAADFGGATAGETLKCHPSLPGEFDFVLETFVADTGVSAQKTYGLTPEPDYPSYFLYHDGDLDLLPSGLYVIRETTTGSESDPVQTGGSDDEEYFTSSNVAGFYYFPAAPTPTATATATPTASATVTPSATFENDPTATATTVATGTIPSEGGGNVPPVRPSPTVTTGTTPDGSGTTGEEVTTLPSTGQGSHGNGGGELYLLLGLAMSLLLAAATLSCRRRV